MSALTASLKDPSKLWIWIGGGIALTLIVAAVSVSNLLRVRTLPEEASQYEARDKAFEHSTPAARSAPLSAALTGGAIAGRVSESASQPADRKIVRTSSMALTVTSPAEAAEKIRVFAESLGGYVETAQINSSQESPSATITIRVPAARLEDAKAELRKLSAKVNSEKTDAQDVTRQYVDMEARIRNLRAEEAQYLEIMRSAKKVPDMLDVSEKLSEVRGEIEQQQAEFAALSKQVETVAITISLLPQAPPESFSVNWKPLRTLKVAYRDALEGLADYASIMIGFLLYLPVILLWVGTVGLGAFASWRVLRRVARVFAASKPAVSPVQPS
ncbi:MAG TPA: DUF4349 domain-containing protein [Terriglobales bacterium]|jgi:hypothetical protein|nr:DUF4349 domain-containing protein [Terriglobales bacterium]